MNAVICNKANGKLKSVPVHVDGGTLYKHKQTDYQILNNFMSVSNHKYLRPFNSPSPFIWLSKKILLDKEQ